MPIVELEKSPRRLVPEVITLYEDGIFPRLSSVKRAVRKSGLVYLGYGQDCVVTKSTLLPETVVAINGQELTRLDKRATYPFGKVTKDCLARIRFINSQIGGL